MSIVETDKTEGKHIFISYASFDHTIAIELLDYLEQLELVCWIDKRDIKIGQHYAYNLADAIRKAGYFIVLLSKAASNSVHVLNEVEQAVRNHITIIPVKLDNSDLSPALSYYLASLHWLVFDLKNKQHSFEELFKRIELTEGYHDKIGWSKESGQIGELQKVKWFSGRNLTLALFLTITLATGIYFFLRPGNNYPTVLSSINWNKIIKSMLKPSDSIKDVSGGGIGTDSSKPPGSSSGKQFVPKHEMNPPAKPVDKRTLASNDLLLKISGKKFILNEVSNEYIFFGNVSGGRIFVKGEAKRCDFEGYMQLDGDWLISKEKSFNGQIQLVNNGTGIQGSISFFCTTTMLSYDF